MTKTIRRKNYFIKPGFQSKLTAIFLMVVVIVANIVGALTYGFLVKKLESKLVNELNCPIDSQEISHVLLFPVILAQLISVFLVTIICVFVTHTIAGPVYRMQRVARNIGEGDLTHFIKLRPFDELKDLADSMNEMTMGLRNKVIAFKEAFSRLRQEATSSDLPPERRLSALSKEIDEVELILDSFVLERVSKNRNDIDEQVSDSDSTDPDSPIEASVDNTPEETV